MSSVPFTDFSDVRISALHLQPRNQNLVTKYRTLPTLATALRLYWIPQVKRELANLARRKKDKSLRKAEIFESMLADGDWDARSSSVGV